MSVIDPKVQALKDLLGLKSASELGKPQKRDFSHVKAEEPEVMPDQFFEREPVQDGFELAQKEVERLLALHKPFI